MVGDIQANNAVVRITFELGVITKEHCVVGRVAGGHEVYPRANVIPIGKQLGKGSVLRWIEARNGAFILGRARLSPCFRRSLRSDP